MIDTPQNLFEVRLTASPTTVELLAEIWDEDVAPFSVEHLTDEETAHFRMFFSDKPAAEAAAEVIAERASLWGMDFQLDVLPLPKENWAEKWKEDFHPQHVGKKIVIVPSWEEYTPKPGEIILQNDPGLAFGTGRHATSRACLEYIEEIVTSSQIGSFLDAGTGTGILAIAAAKLGVPTVEAFDNEPQAVRAAAQNAEKNEVAEKIEIFAQDLFEYKPWRTYDLVAANILCAVLEKNVERLCAAVAPNGRLILSGILDEQYNELAKLFAAKGLEEISEKSLEGWRTGLWRKPL